MFPNWANNHPAGILHGQGVLQRGNSAATSTVRFSISNARSHFKQREFAESVLNYIAVLKLLPATPGDGRRKYMAEFLDALRAYLRQESDEGRAEQVLQIAQSIYESESALWRTVAEHLFEKGKFLRCIEVFGRAMDCARDEIEWLHAASSQENARSNLFDVWHWRMLNDGRRNEAFSRAIRMAIEKQQANGDHTHVLDIGCGSGIFSIVAAKQEEQESICVACERDEVLCSVARQCFVRNGVQVDLVECDSKKLELNPVDKCNVLVTETMDCAIFGERIAETILDAKQRLLTQDAVIIPSKATALFSLLECTYVANENAFECFAGAQPVALLSSSCYIPQGSREESGRRILPPAPYTCAHLVELADINMGKAPPEENSAKIPERPPAHRLLSDPVKGLMVDFNNLEQLRQINSDRLCTEVVIRATAAGTASAVCVWFQVHLYGDIEICTAPEEGHCWQQALFPFYPPVQVSPGSALHFQVFVKDHIMHVQPITTGPTSLSVFTVCSTRIVGAQPELLRAPASLDLLAMNDPAIRTFFHRAVPSQLPMSQLLDCTDLLLFNGNKGVVGQRYQMASFHSAIRYIGREAATNLERAVCKPGGAILFWPFGSTGSLIDDYCASIIELHLRCPGTLLIPSRITLTACLVSSEQLYARSGLLFDEQQRHTTYCGADLTPIDSYRVSHYQELETRTLDFEALSEPVELFQMCFRERADDDLSQLTKLKHEAHFACTRPGRCHAILLWFELGAPSGEQLDLRTGTLSCKSSAYVLREPKTLQPGKGLKAQFSLHHGNVIFHWVKDAIFL